YHDFWKCYFKISRAQRKRHPIPSLAYPLVRHSPPRQPPSRPGGLEVEAAGHPVDVEDLSCQEQAGAHAALHGLEVDLLQAHAAARHELFLEHALARHLIAAGMNL